MSSSRFSQTRHKPLSLTICTQMKDYGSSTRSYQVEKLSLTLEVVSPLPPQRECPSPPRPVKNPVFCWSHVAPCGS